MLQLNYSLYSSFTIPENTQQHGYLLYIWKHMGKFMPMCSAGMSQSTPAYPWELLPF
jgi:hypothetical protein